MPSTSEYISKRLSEFRESLAQVEALPQLSFIALIVGACTGLIIVVFRLAIETPFHILNMSSAENFEALEPSARVALIMVGTILIAAALQSLNKYQRQMSVSHVIDRLHNHQGNMPSINWLAQFVLAIIAIVSGQSAGREGPAVHLGAGASSQIGRWMRLPNNSMQTIIACGVAAGISASFDTPLAGVIFTMEVIIMEYSIVGFVPVILASVIGSAVCKSLIGESLAFNVGDSSMSSLLELGFITVMGLIIAILAGGYIRLHLMAMRLAKYPIALRLLVAGILTSAVAYHVPEIMGLGYDTIQGAIQGNFVISALIVIAIAKLCVTPIVVALGIPGGLIGPSLLVGACTGAVLGFSVQLLFPNIEVNPNLYILLGMVGMMAAVINAPLAALIAVLELSHNPDIIFPAMLMIVVACLTTRQVFKVRSVFIEQLAHSGRDIEIGPATRALRRAGIMSIMNRRFLITDKTITFENAKYVLSTQPQWIIFSVEECLFTLWAADLAHFIDNAPEKIQLGEMDILLSEVPGQRHMLHPVLGTASLYDALGIIRKSQCEVLYVTSNIHSHRSVHGIVTLDAIKNHYQPKGISDAMD